MKNGSLPRKVQLIYPFAILFLLTCFPIIPQIIGEKVRAFRDMTGIFIPFELAVRDVISSDGWLAPWNPYSGVGKPLLADPFAFMLYPPHLFSRLIPVPYNFHVMLVFHHYIAGLGAYLLARTLGMSVFSALVSGVTFSSGGYLLSCDNMTNALYSVSWFPLVLREAILIQRDPRYYRIVSISWLLAFSFLGGLPEVFLMEIVAIFLLAVEHFAILKHKIAFKSILVLGLGLLGSGLLLSPMLYLLFQYASQSGRHLNMPQVQFSSYLFDFLGFFFLTEVLSLAGDFISRGRWWNPALSEYPLMIALYCGPLALGSLVMVHSVRGLYWSVVAIVIYILSLGDSGILLPAVRSVFPVIGMFRYPEKLLLGIHVLLSMSSGFVLTGIRKKWRIALFCIGGISILFFFGPLLIFVFLLGITLVCFSDPEGSMTIPIASGFQILVILFIHTCAYPSEGWNELMHPPKITRGIAGTRVYVNEPRDGFPANEVDQVLWRKNHLYQAWSGVFGIQNINTPSTLNLQAHDAIQDAIAKSSRDKVGELFGSLGVSSVISPFQLNGYDSLEFVSGDEKEGYLYSVSGFDGRVYFLEPETGRRADGVCSVESVVHSGPSSWEGRVSCIKPAVLVLTETAYPGWSVTIDTVDKPLVSVPYQLLGVALNPGSQDVRFSFNADGMRVFWRVFFITVLVQVFFVAGAVRISQRPLILLGQSGIE